MSSNMGSRSWPVYTVEWTSIYSWGTQGACATTMWYDSAHNQYANFWGGDSRTSTNALVWQWISGNNDYDQTDLTHWNALFGTNYAP